MIIWRETAKRFLTTFLALQVMLTLLYVFIDFFEKSTRCGDASMLQIMTYLGLNSLPLAVETATQSLWLAVVLIAKDLDQSREWEAYQLINIRVLARMMPICVLAGSIALCAAVLNESIAGHWKVAALTYKRLHLQKKNEQQSGWQHPQHTLFREGSSTQTRVKINRASTGAFEAALCKTHDEIYHCVSGKAPQKSKTALVHEAQQQESVEHGTMREWYQKYREFSSYGCLVQARRALQKVYEQAIKYLVCAVYPIVSMMLYWNMVGRGASWWLLALIPYCVHELLFPLFSWISRMSDCGMLVFIPLVLVSLLVLL